MDTQFVLCPTARNVPISLAKQRREVERLQDKLLQDYLKRKNAVEVAKEQVRQ